MVPQSGGNSNVMAYWLSQAYHKMLTYTIALHYIGSHYLLRFRICTPIGTYQMQVGLAILAWPLFELIMDYSMS